MTYVEDAEVRKGLREPFDPKQIGKLPKPTSKENRKGECNVCKGWHGLPAIHVDFVGHAAVTDRLNKLVPGWTWEPIERFLGEDGRCWIHGVITIGGITRHEFGDGKDPKEAVGNFIRRGAMRFGVAIDLWSKEELEESSDIEPVPSRVTPGSPGDGMVEEDGSGAPASDPVSGEPAAYGEGAAGSSDRPGNQTPAEGAGEDSHAPSSVEQRKDFRAYLAERYGTAQALLMARSLFQTQTRKVPNMTVLDLDELQAVDVELKARKLEGATT